MIQIDIDIKITVSVQHQHHIVSVRILLLLYYILKSGYVAYFRVFTFPYKFYNVFVICSKCLLNVWLGCGDAWTNLGVIALWAVFKSTKKVYLWIYFYLISCLSSIFCNVQHMTLIYAYFRLSLCTSCFLIIWCALFFRCNIKMFITSIYIERVLCLKSCNLTKLIDYL